MSIKVLQRKKESVLALYLWGLIYVLDINIYYKSLLILQMRKYACLLADRLKLNLS